MNEMKRKKIRKKKKLLKQLNIWGFYKLKIIANHHPNSVGFTKINKNEKRSYKMREINYAFTQILFGAAVFCLSMVCFRSLFNIFFSRKSNSKVVKGKIGIKYNFTSHCWKFATNRIRYTLHTLRLLQFKYWKY